MATPINVDTSQAVGAFRQLRIAQREALNELAGLTAGTQEYINASNRLSEVTNQINDINDTMRQVSGAPIENLSNSFRLLSGQVMNLDFDGAAQSLSTFGAGIKNVKIGDLTNGLKAFGKGLLDIGKALLANPIFLLVAAVTAIGTAMYALKDKIKPIGIIFDAIGDSIGFVVQQFKDLSDWIGFSSFAAEEAAEKQINAAKRTEDAVVARYDSEIKIAQAAGKNTEKLEKEKQIAVLESAKLQIEAIKSVAKVNGKFTEDQIKQLEDLGKVIYSASTELKVIEAKADKERQDEKDKANKEALDKLKKKKEEEKKYLEGLAKKALDDQKANDAKELANTVALIDSVNKLKDEQKLMYAKTEQEKIAITLARLEKEAELEYNATNQSAEAYAAYQEKLRIIRENAAFQTQQADDTQAKAEKEKLDSLALERATFEDGKIQKSIFTRDAQIQSATDIYNAQLELLKNQNLSEEEYALKSEELAQELADKKKAINQASFDDTIRGAQALSQATQSIANIAFAAQLKQAKGNAAEEEKIRKKQWKVNKAFGIANATIDGIQGVAKALNNPYPLNLVLAAASAVAAAANIAAIASTQYTGGDGGSGGTPSTPTNLQTGGLAAANQGPNVNTSGTQFNQGAIGASNAVNTGSSSNGSNNAQKVYVLESDITDKQQNRVKTESFSSF